MPLGLMAGMTYEEKEAQLAPGQDVLFHSDGYVEAHNPAGEMFGFPRLKNLVAQHPGGEGLIDLLLAELDTFTGEGWEQEDDVTLVVLQRTALATNGSDDAPRLLAEFSLPSEPGNERIASARVADAVRSLGLPSARLERLKTAVAEATMNAIEHGNRNRPELPVTVRVGASAATLSVWVTDTGGGRPIPDKPATPNLEAKLAGNEPPRGWGLFLIRNMVDDFDVVSDDTHHTIELRLRLVGDGDLGPRGGAA
jgi:anti-sigma regulatory factor (Ser/Thr protein kinase)